jgi:hypothetical protein
VTKEEYLTREAKIASDFAKGLMTVLEYVQRQHDLAVEYAQSQDWHPRSYGDTELRESSEAS